jgi:serine/threonine protein kinase
VCLPRTCSYGEVFKVRRHSDGMEMVLKEVSMVGICEQEEREILNETSCMMQLSHPHIISYFGSFLERGSLHIVMEFASGGDLQCLIRRHAQAGTFVSEERLWKFLIQLTQGLQHAHSRRILHRDVKASNVFIDANDNIKIGDLGLGKVLGAGENPKPRRATSLRCCLHRPHAFVPYRSSPDSYDLRSP